MYIYIFIIILFSLISVCMCFGYMPIYIDVYVYMNILAVYMCVCVCDTLRPFKLIQVWLSSRATTQFSLCQMYVSLFYTRALFLLAFTHFTALQALFNFKFCS